MSSPLQSLKKGPKSRMFVGTGLSLDTLDQRPIPFRSKPNYSDDESKLLDDITSNMAASRIKSHQTAVNSVSHQVTGNTGPSPLPGGTGLPKISRTGQKTNNHTAAPSDKDLMSVMMNKITLLEQRVQYQNKDIQDKDKRIHVLEEKLKILKKANDSNEPSHVKELEKKCLLLQQQIHEMETFLSDYGMVWLGEKSLDGSDVYLDEDEDEDEDERMEENTSQDGAVLWRPGSSVSSVRPFQVNFDQLIENIRDLNVLAGEGVAKVTKTTDGARLKIPEAVPLTLYSNGIALYSGPFRPYTDPSTQQCIQDLLDGYFPSELQQRYPDGIPFTVSDKRNVKFVDKRQQKIFHGAGQVLGGEKKPSRLIPSNINKPSKPASVSRTSSVSHTSSEVCVTVPDSETSELPGPKLRVDDLLNSLPKSVIRGGKVIDIRDSIGQHIKGDKQGENEVSVVETDVSVEWKKRLEDKNVENRPVTPRNVTTLRVKSECGNQTYIVKMKFSETIGDLKSYLQKHRSVDASRISIMSTYPSRSYDDNTETLQECGLTPNAVLHLRLTKQ